MRSASLLQARAQTPALLLLLMPVRHSLLLTDLFLGDCPWHWPIHAPSLNTALALEAPHKAPWKQTWSRTGLGCP